ERAQRQRHLRLQRERGVAAREQQLQPLVRDRALIGVALHDASLLEQASLLREPAAAANAIDGAVARGRDQPRSRVGREPRLAPALGGDREGLLRGFLGEIEVAEEANQRGQDPRPLLAEYLLDQR